MGKSTKLAKAPPVKKARACKTKLEVMGVDALAVADIACIVAKDGAGNTGLLSKTIAVSVTQDDGDAISTAKSNDDTDLEPANNGEGKDRKLTNDDAYEGSEEASSMDKGGPAPAPAPADEDKIDKENDQDEESVREEAEEEEEEYASSSENDDSDDSSWDGRD